MARLNRKNTKAAIVKLLKENEQTMPLSVRHIATEKALLEVAKELELDIKPEDYKTV